MKQIVTVILLLLTGLGLYGQQDILLSQYMFNQLVLNPAYTGSKDYVSTTLVHRSQWVGFEGAPVTQALSIHGPLPDRINAFGLMVANDHVGVTNRTDFFGSYAYHWKMTSKATLSLGLNGGISRYAARVQDLTIWDPNDELFTGGTRTNVLPNAGVGAYFYTPRFYAGLSVPHLISYDPREVFNMDISEVHIPHQRRHYFLTAGYAWVVHPDLVFKPSFLLKYVDNAPVNCDLNLNVLFKERLWVGASYRTGDAVLGLLELQLTKQFRIGYAYDYPISDLGNFTSGSHEIMIGYDFGYDILKTKTPRYF